MSRPDVPPVHETELPRAEGLNRLLDPLARVAYRGAYTLARVYWFVRRPRTRGVFVGVWHAGRVLLVQNSYKSRFSMPGGGYHGDESPEECGARELREEVGVTMAPGSLRTVFQTVGSEENKDDHVHFVEMDVDAEPPLTIDRREVTWAGFIDLDTALRLPVSGLVRAYLEDAKRRRS
ncbi:NUDIX domain-containing protein [Pyxidicoccus fallax]|uniref:NUDIX hydrolase n=1 Tax=Pyxidicoccus fallax TaxID=394095 RepID=A0A848LXY6_9BACT|nr:NUDIX hydrolase [Pyxidicoccus fallax]NMO22094.1 NUDIX hydrolase [Pyxidicoccus fallax]